MALNSEAPEPRTASKHALLTPSRKTHDRANTRRKATAKKSTMQQVQGQFRTRSVQEHIAENKSQRGLTIDKEAARVRVERQRPRAVQTAVRELTDNGTKQAIERVPSSIALQAFDREDEHNAQQRQRAGQPIRVPPHEDSGSE